MAGVGYECKGLGILIMTGILDYDLISLLHKYKTQAVIPKINIIPIPFRTSPHQIPGKARRFKQRVSDYLRRSQRRRA